MNINHLIKSIRRTAFITAVLTIVPSVSATADERPQHFEGQKIETWQQAKMALQTANEELKTLLSQPSFSMEHSVKIHQLSYTMENALKFMRKTIVDTESVLEELHLASESPNLEETKNLGDAYLQQVKSLDDRAPQ